MQCYGIYYYYYYYYYSSTTFTECCFQKQYKNETPQNCNFSIKIHLLPTSRVLLCLNPPPLCLAIMISSGVSAVACPLAVGDLKRFTFIDQKRPLCPQVQTTVILFPLGGEKEISIQGLKIVQSYLKFICTFYVSSTWFRWSCIDLVTPESIGKHRVDFINLIAFYKIIQYFVI